MPYCADLSPVTVARCKSDGARPLARSTSVHRADDGVAWPEAVQKIIASVTTAGQLLVAVLVVHYGLGADGGGAELLECGRVAANRLVEAGVRGVCTVCVDARCSWPAGRAWKAQGLQCSCC